MSITVEPASVPTSISLLGRATSGDGVAWQKMVQLYGPLVYSWARRTGLQPHDAADATQETFSALATRLPTFDSSRPGASFRGWLWTIARNKSADLIRRGKKLPVARGGSTNLEMIQAMGASENGEIPSGEHVGDVDQQQIVRRALALMRTSFEPQTWQAFWRTVIDGLTPDEVAAELSMSRWAVYKARSRVLHCLRTELEGLEHLD